MNFNNKLNKNLSNSASPAQQASGFPLNFSIPSASSSCNQKKCSSSSNIFFLNSSLNEGQNTIQTLQMAQINKNHHQWMENFNNFLFSAIQIPIIPEILDTTGTQVIPTKTQNNKQKKKNSSQQQLFEEQQSDNVSLPNEEGITKKRVRGENGVMRHRCFEALYSLVHFQGQLETDNIVQVIYQNFYANSETNQFAIKKKIKKRNYDVLKVLENLQLAKIAKRDKKMMISSTQNGEKVLMSTERYREIMKKRVDQKEMVLKQKKELLQKLKRQKQLLMSRRNPIPGADYDKMRISNAQNKNFERTEPQNNVSTNKQEVLDKIASISQSTMHEQLGSSLMKMFDDLSIQMDKPGMEEEDDFFINDFSELDLRN